MGKFPEYRRKHLNRMPSELVDGDNKTNKERYKMTG